MGLRKHIFNSKESPTTICEEFQIAPKKLYKGMMGKCYDPGVKLSKAEKAQKELETNIKKLKMLGTKEDQSKKTTSAPTTSDVQATPEMDMTEIPELISSDEEEQQLKGTKKVLHQQEASNKKVQEQIVNSFSTNVIPPFFEI